MTSRRGRPRMASIPSSNSVSDITETLFTTSMSQAGIEAAVTSQKNPPDLSISLGIDLIVFLIQSSLCSKLRKRSRGREEDLATLLIDYKTSL